MRDAAILVAASTAILYLCGSLYLKSYYGRLGIPERAIEWQVATVLEASILPLAGILFFTFLVAVVSAHLAPKKDSTRVGLFHPIPSALLLASIFMLWLFKVFFDLFNPQGPVEWLGYPRRSVLFYGFLTVVVVGLHLYFRFQGERRRLKRMAGFPGFITSMLMFAVGLGIFEVAAGRDWPYATWETVFLAVFVPLVIYSVILWARGQRSHVALQGVVADTFRSKGMATLFHFMAVLFLVLGVGISGGVDAKEVLAGCAARDSIEFDPVPETLDENATYWLVLQQGNTYYVRQANAESGGEPLVVHAGAGTVAKFGWIPPTC